MSLWFVTPAHGRYQITQHTLAQRAKLCERIGARCVVVAEDGNLSIADRLGLDTLPMDNLFLGRRFNAGVEYALSRGATHITLFDSDSISLDATYDTLADVPEFRPNYSFIFPDGKRRAEIQHQRWVQTIWPAAYMELTYGHPCDYFINRHVSSSALRNIEAAVKANGLTMSPVTTETHQLEQVGFQSEDNISNSMNILYSARVGKYAKDMWTPLLETYIEDQEQILALKYHYERNQIVS